MGMYTQVNPNISMVNLLLLIVSSKVTLSSVLNILDHATLASYLGEGAAGNDTFQEPDQLATTFSIESEPVQESFQPTPRRPIPELVESELNADNENATANIDTVFGLMPPLTIDNPLYLSIDQRQESFYETSFHQPKKLAYAGFYYAGYSTAVMCAYCAGSLRLGNDVEKIYFSHAKHFLRCGYIRYLLGDELVNSIHAGERLEGPIMPDFMYDREEDLYDIPTRRLCRCCCRRRNSILFMPCRHLLLCKDCIYVPQCVIIAEHKSCASNIYLEFQQVEQKNIVCQKK